MYASPDKVWFSPDRATYWHYNKGTAIASLYVDDTLVQTFTAANGAITATPAEINNAADVSARVQELTVSGAVTAGVQSIELNHATVAVAATIASLVNHPGLLVVKNTSASGSASHTVTVTTGTVNGTNKVLTLNAPGEAIILYIDSAGNGVIVENIGTVGVSGT